MRQEALTRSARQVGVSVADSAELTPTRCVQRLSPVVALAAMVGDAGLSRGRIALPPLGGGEASVGAGVSTTGDGR